MERRGGHASGRGEGDGRVEEARGRESGRGEGDGRAGEASQRERRLGGRGVGKTREMGEMGEMGGDGAEGGNGGDGGAGGWVRRVNGRRPPCPNKAKQKEVGGSSPPAETNGKWVQM